MMISMLSLASVMILYYGSKTSTRITLMINRAIRLQERVDNLMPSCCTELTKDCFACSTGVTVMDFCSRHQGEYGCPD